MAYTIKQIEDAIITALDPLKESLGVREIKTYTHELDFDDKESLRRLMLVIPAVYVVYTGGPYAEHGPRKVEEMYFSVFFADKNVGGDDTARRGSATNPGTYAMIEAARGLLYGEMLSKEILPFDLVRTVPIFFSKGISVYASDYKTGQAHLYTGL